MTRQVEWTKESIKIAFERFYNLEGRLPTAPEIDKLEYLPSSRQIQRRYGGLRVLRAELGYDVTDFGSGAARSALATSNNSRSMNAERNLEKEFIDIFGELFVHTEKLYGNGRNRVDFLVYTKVGNFGVDIFTTETQRDMQKNINIKIDKYADFPKSIPLYFAVASLSLSDKDVQDACRGMSKLKQIPNLEIVTISELVQRVKTYEANPEQKRSIINLVLSNLQIDDDQLRYKTKEPFKTMVLCNKNSTWLRRLGSNQ